jgi:Protein of unknown function (DUF3768)
VLKGTGRVIVGSVTPEVYKRIEDYAAKATGALAVKASNETAAGLNPASEQTANTAEKGKPAPIATDPWDGLRVGSITQGVEAMPLDQRRSLLQKVPSFDAFGEDNDPHGEHDFGAVDEAGER